MCVALKFVADGKTRTATAGVQGVTVPVLMRSGQVRFIEWGAPTARHVSDPDSPGYVMKLPAGNWIDLDTLREGAWWRFKPRPVKIVAIAFGVYLELERLIPLEAGQYLQGGPASEFAAQRV